MQKVYLLLRNNQQTGPYNLEELLQLNLKPFDLVWMDGKSAAWQYPGEIASLQPFVPATPQPDLPFMPIATAAIDKAAGSTVQKITASIPSPSPKTIFVSLPQRPVSMQPVMEEPIADRSYQAVPDNRYSEPVAVPGTINTKTVVNTEPLKETTREFKPPWGYQPVQSRKNKIKKKRPCIGCNDRCSDRRRLLYHDETFIGSVKTKYTSYCFTALTTINRN
jgi:hypothetical protein